MDKEKSLQTLAEEGTSTKQETYHIWNYMKEHTSLLIATISAIVAVISYIIGLLTFIYQRLILQIWNVDVSAIDFSLKGQVYYYLTVGLIYCISILIINNILHNVFEKQQNILAEYYVVNTYRSEINKDIRQLKKGYKNKVKGYDRQVYNEKAEQLNRLEKRIKKIRKNLRQYRKSIFFSTLYRLIAVALCVLPIVVLFVTTMGKVSWSIIIWAVYFCLTVVTTKALVHIFNRDRSKRSIKKYVKEQIKAGNSDIDSLLLPLKREEKDITKGLQRWIFSDDRIKELIQTLVLGLCSLFLMTLIGEFDAENQKDFWTYTNDCNQYIVVYQNANKYILKKAIIEGDILTVYTDEQRIIFCDDISLEYVQFLEVNRK